MLFVDLVIVASSFLIFNEYGDHCILIIIIAVMATSVDWVLNGIRQSVQFLSLNQDMKRSLPRSISITPWLYRIGCASDRYSQKPQKVTFGDGQAK
jgi:hypothetical protein